MSDNDTDTATAANASAIHVTIPEELPALDKHTTRALTQLLINVRDKRRQQNTHPKENE